MIDAAATAGEGEAVVVPGFARGAALLRGEDGELVRLSWEGEDALADRRRVLPAGRYALVGYRLLAQDDKGQGWHVSASAVKGVTLDLAAGRETKLKLDPTIRIGARFQADNLGVDVKGMGGSGLTIYAQEKRIPIRWRRLDAAGATRAEGKLEYG